MFLGYLALSLQEISIITFLSSYTKAFAINEIANIKFILWPIYTA